MLRLEGFTEISDSLRGGVYALAFRGVVVYVGKSKSMLVRIYSHKVKRTDKPSWFPVKGIHFDQVFVMPCHPDRIDALEYEMINRYKPKLNYQLKNGLPVDIRHLIAGLVPQPPEPPLRRRI